MGWGFVWLMVIMKIPIVMLLALVWWAVRQTPDESGRGEDGGSGNVPDRPRPHRPRPRAPRPARRGPHPGVRAPVRPRVRAAGTRRVRARP